MTPLTTSLLNNIYLLMLLIAAVLGEWDRVLIFKWEVIGICTWPFVVGQYVDWECVDVDELICFSNCDRSIDEDDELFGGLCLGVWTRLCGIGDGWLCVWLCEWWGDEQWSDVWCWCWEWNWWCEAGWFLGWLNNSGWMAATNCWTLLENRFGFKIPPEPAMRFSCQLRNKAGTCTWRK